MPTYVSLMTYTDKGIRSIRNSPKRLDAAKATLAEMGGTVQQVLMLMGPYDLLLIYEASDDAISARFQLMLGAQGNVRTDTMRAFPEPAFREFIASLS